MNTQIGGQMALTRELVEQWLDATSRPLGGVHVTVPKSLIVELCRFWLAHQWQPIETAPQDGRVVLFCDQYENRWTDCSPGNPGNGCGYPPTKWMPLPHAKEDAKV